MKRLIIILLLLPCFAKAQNVYYWFGMNTTGQPVIDNLPYTQLLPLSTQALFSQINKATTNNTTPTLETTLIGTVSGTKSIALTGISVGKTYEITVDGSYTAPLVNLGNFTTKTYLGATAINSLTLTNLVAGLTSSPFHSVLYFTVKATGASGQVSTTGFITFGTSATASATVLYTPTTTNIDLSGSSLTLNITGYYSNNTAGQSVTSINVFCRPVY